MNIRLETEIKDIKIKTSRNEISLEIEVANNSFRARNEASGSEINNIVSSDPRKTEDVSKLFVKFSANETTKSKNFYDLILSKYLLKKFLNSNEQKWKICIKNINDNYLEWIGYDNIWSSAIGTRYSLKYTKGDSLSEKNDLVINLIEFSTGNPIPSTPPFTNNFDDYRDQIFALNDLLNKIKNFYLGKSYFDLSKYPGPNSLEADLVELKKYPNHFGTGEEGDTKEKTIYNINDPFSKKRIFKEDIDNSIDLLREWIVWNKIVGLNTFQEISKAKENGFVILKDGTINPTIGGASSSEFLEIGSLNVEKIRETFPEGHGKYKKFDITQSSLKKDIDSFREVFGSVINGVDYNEKIKLNECRGFKPSDFSSGSSYGDHIEKMTDNDGWIKDTNGTEELKFRYSKRVIDIWTAPDLDAAIDLALFLEPYTHLRNGGDERYQPVDNNDDCLLFFNEMDGDGLTKLEQLDTYYAALKHKKCGSKALNKNFVVGVGSFNNHSRWGGDWTKSNYFNDSTTIGPKSRIDQAYQTVRKIIEILEKDYSNHKFDKLAELMDDKEELDNVSNQTQRLSNNAYAKIYNRWEKAISKKIKEIRNKVKSLKINASPEQLLESAKTVLGFEIDKIESDSEKSKKMKEEMTDTDYNILFDAHFIMKKFVSVKDDKEKNTTKLGELEGLKNIKSVGWEVINKYKVRHNGVDIGYADYRLDTYEKLKEEKKDFEQKVTELFESVWKDDYLNEDAAKTAIDNLSLKDSSTAKEKENLTKEKNSFKDKAVPRMMLAKKIKAVSNSESAKLAGLLKFIPNEYSGKNLKNTKKREELEKRLGDLNSFVKANISDGDKYTLYHGLTIPEKKIITDLVSEIQKKVIEMKYEIPPKKNESPLKSLGLVLVLLILVGAGVYFFFQWSKKGEEETSEQ